MADATASDIAQPVLRPTGFDRQHGLVLLVGWLVALFVTLT
jgi:hypothetical protein